MLRPVAFVFWALVGTGLSFAALYLFTPFGVALMVILAAASRVMLALDDGGNGRRERLGVFAGPGGFGLVIAAATDHHQQRWLIAGGVIVAVVLVAYRLLPRRSPRRGSVPTGSPQ